MDNASVLLEEMKGFREGTTLPDCSSFPWVVALSEAVTDIDRIDRVRRA